MQYSSRRIFALIILLSILFLNGYSQDKKSTLFTLLDADRTSVRFSNDLVDSGEVNIFNEESFYNGGGVAIGDINNDDLLDIFFTGNQVPDKLYLNKGEFRFEDISEGAGIIDNDGWSSGVSMVDVNGDGHLDIYVCKDMYPDEETRKNKFYINNGDLTFTDLAEEMGLASNLRTVHATFFDYDRDNDLDVYLVNHPSNPGFFSDRSVEKNQNPEMCSRLFQNNEGVFKDVTEKAGMSMIAYSLSAAVSDFNNDGWPDIWVCNDFVDPDYLFINQRNGSFINVINKSVKHITYSSMGSDVADIDNDGKTDIYVLDMRAEDHHRLTSNMGGMKYDQLMSVRQSGGHLQYFFNTLHWNRGIDQEGNLVFSEIGQMAGITSTDWSWSALFADFDNDGLKDLFVSNGYRIDFRNMDALKKLTNYSKTRFQAYMNNNPRGAGNFDVWEVLDFDEVMSLYPSKKLPNYVYKSINGLQFENKIKEWGLEEKTFSNGAAYGDLDNDGDLDLVINNINQIASMYRNNVRDDHKSNYLKVKLAKGSKSISFFGARVQIEYLENLKEKKQIYELVNARGFQSTSSQDAHFGLGKVESVGKLTVFWPDGKISVMDDVKSNQTLTLDYKKAKSPGFSATNYFGSLNKGEKKDYLFIDITDHIGIKFVHHENLYNDFEFEPFLPHKLSAQGPCACIGDLNGDQLDDIFIGGSSGIDSKFLIQQTDGSFFEKATGLKNIFEDTGCALFDADNDDDLDLYVCSGSNEFKAPLGYQDRLFLNNGKGEFSKAFNSLPWFPASSNVVAPNDFDKDGDMDLFIGGRLLPRNYPLSASSSILINEGMNEDNEPIFRNITQDAAPFLENFGMVTDAIWTDFDKDGDADIIITGEWMPITIIRNNNGKFENVTVDVGFENTAGWWNCIAAADFDQDGDEDYVAGNLGWNYRFKASPTEPFEAFYHDFDNNGTDDLVLSYYNMGIRYPLRGMMYTQQQMPALKSKFEDHESFSRATLDDVYGVQGLENAKKFHVYEFASVYIENGGSGKLRYTPLPLEAQVSSINDFLIYDVNNDSKLDIVLAGGLYNSEVETSPNDAGVGLYLEGDGIGGFKVVGPEDSGLYLFSEVKKLKLMEIEDIKTLVSVPNNDRVKVYRISKR